MGSEWHVAATFLIAVPDAGNLFPRGNKLSVHGFSSIFASG
jgi:hypothetical protein